VRAAAERLQRVVVALLAMFRSGAEVQRQRDRSSPRCAARLPVEGLVVDARGTTPLSADADLVTAAVLNLIDNAQRHGAATVTFSTPRRSTCCASTTTARRPAGRRRALQAAIDAQAYEGRTGLGLMLADLVARAHGGKLVLADDARGFAAVLHLGEGEPPAADARARQDDSRRAGATRSTCHEPSSPAVGRRDSARASRRRRCVRRHREHARATGARGRQGRLLDPPRRPDRRLPRRQTRRSSSASARCS
jgi:hypothetical protein